MASNIKFKRSSVQNRVPTTTQLELGELALNTYDGKLYTEINTGSASVVEIGSKLSSLVVDGANGGGGGDVTLHGTTAGKDLLWDYSANQLVFANDTEIKFGVNASNTDRPLFIKYQNSNTRNQVTGKYIDFNVSDARFKNIDNGNHIAKFWQSKVVLCDSNGNDRLETTGGGVDIFGTGALKVPVGTTAQRQGSATAGDIRYNSTLGAFEGYTTSWGELGGGGIGIGSTTVNPGSGVVGDLVGVGYTTINFVGAGLSVTGYGTTIVVDIGNAVSRKYGRKIHSYTATANQTAFTGLSYTDGASQVSVYLNGAKLSAATYTATSGSTVVLGTGASVGDEVEILVIDSGVDISRTVHSYTATAGQTVFSGLGYEDGGDLDVYLNGIRLAQSDYTANNGTILTLATGASVGDLLEIVDMGPGASWKSGFGGDADDVFRMNGGVGIGTTNPTDKLNIVGNVEILGILTATTFSGVDTDKIEEGNTSVETVDTGSNGHIKFTTEGTEIVKITSDGKVYHTGGGNGRRYSFASDGSSHYMKYDSTLNGIILNGYGGITFETNGTNERVRIDSSGNLNVTGITTVGGNLIVTGNLQVDGTQTTVNSTTMTVDDKNIVLGSGAANDAAADGGGITLESGNGNKTFNWVDSTDAWTSSEHIHLGDNKKLLLGASSDLQIFHDDAGDRGDSGFNKIESVDKHLDIQCNNNVAITVPGANSGADTPIKMALFQPSNSVDLYFNGNKKFETLNTGAKVTGDITISDKIIHDGDTNTAIRFPAADQIQLETNGTARATVTNSTTTFDNNVTFNGNGNVLAGNYLDIQDNKKLRLGTDGDCAFYFNGAATLIETGNKIIHIQTDSSIRLQKNSPQAHMLIANAGGSVDLYHNGTKKLETDADGIRIGSGGGDNTIVDLYNASYDNGVIQYYNGSIALKTGSSNGDRTFQVHTAGTERLRIHSNGAISAGFDNDSYELSLQGKAGGAPTLWLRDGTTTGSPRIIFGDTGNALQGSIYYHNNGDYMTFSTNGSTERVRITSGGSLIVGNQTSTGYKLCVSEAAHTRVEVISTSNDSAGAWFKVYNSGTLTSQSTIRTSGGSLQVYTGTTSEAERLRIDSSGRLLIGTTTPGESSADDLTLSTSAHTGMTIRSGTTSWGSIFFSDGTSGAAQYDGSIEYLHGSNYMRFKTAQGERLRITSNGTVIAGATSVSGGNRSQYSILAAVSNNSSSTGHGVFTIQAGANSSSGNEVAQLCFSDPQGDYAWIQAFADAATGATDKPGRLVFSTSSDGSAVPTERMRIASTGAVKIGDGTGANGGGLAIYGGTVNNSSGADATLYIQSETSSDWGFYLNKPGHEYGLRISTLNTATLALGIYDQNNNNKHQFKGNGDYIAGGQITSGGSMKISGNLGIGQDPSGTYPLMILKNTRYLIGFRNSSADANYPWFTHDTVSSKSEMRIHFNSVADRFGVNEDGDVWASGSIDSQSDIKLKKNIVTIDNALDKVLKLRGAEYDRIDKDNQHEIGVIAQEVEKVIPELVHGEDIKTVSYGNITAVLIEAIKEQNEIINNMKKEIEELKGN